MIDEAVDLITNQRDTCKGFLLQALTKIDRATPYVAEAIRLKSRVDEVADVHELAKLMDVRDMLLCAAGFSDKARAHLSEAELTRAIEEALKKIATSAQEGWRDEVVYRYLLTKGDSLGGSVRNITGALATARFASAVIAQLSRRELRFTEVRSKSNPDKIQEILWEDRIVLFDKKPNFVGNSIDVIMLNLLGQNRFTRTLLEDSSAYIACGELKGGIDPAGADEHWKTANSALQRIRQCFEATDTRPGLFFVGAAIETSMAEEIFEQLKDGRLQHAANFTKAEQVVALADWLISL